MAEDFPDLLTSTGILRLAEVFLPRLQIYFCRLGRELSILLRLNNRFRLLHDPVSDNMTNPPGAIAACDWKSEYFGLWFTLMLVGAFASGGTPLARLHAVCLPEFVHGFTTWNACHASLLRSASKHVEQL